MSLSTATQRVLRVPEILHQILEESSSGDQVRMARVSKTWFDVAVGFIWKEIPDILHLLEILAPLTFEDDKVVFTRPLTSHDWARFDLYAGKVRVLRQEMTYARALHPDLILELLVTRRPSELLPRLRDLHLYPCTLDCASLFLHSTITSLGIVLKGTCPLLGPLLSSLPVKVPGLEELTLFQDDDLYPPEANIEGSLVDALHGLTSLKLLRLPPLWLTSPISNAASSCGDLRDFVAMIHPFSFAEETKLSKSSDFKYLMSTSLPPDGFLSLENFEIPTTFSRARQVLSQGHHFNTLTNFLIISPCPESPHAYGQFLAMLSTCCPALEYLTISSIPIEALSDDFPAVLFDDIEPVTQLTRLRLLDLQHPLPFQIDTANVISIAQALPDITTLLLNPTPIVKGASALSVGVLSPLLSSFPRIEQLGLYMDTSDKSIPSPTSDEQYGTVVMDSGESTGLQALEVGKTSVSSPIQLAIYLSRIIPLHCTILDFGRFKDEAEASEDEERDAEHWSEVRRLIPAFKQVRAEALKGLESRASRRLSDTG
ncbi:hypothetical protein EYR40_008151 [Pleurotus pulmonarius]|nr:hypothetical protein EYR38_007541 [Pleurotus pulmonarius]KAF4597686.1 hypothetical protein EYR40_008151 [Pleurotus pulmonarius]